MSVEQLELLPRPRPYRVSPTSQHRVVVVEPYGRRPSEVVGDPRPLCTWCGDVVAEVASARSTLSTGLNHDPRHIGHAIATAIQSLQEAGA
jgi:hypothetical protein